mgnify:CR=1 FL=1
MFRLLAAIIGLLVLSANFFGLGMLWLEQGYGLHPIISFPLGTIALGTVYVLIFLEDKK